MSVVFLHLFTLHRVMLFHIWRTGKKKFWGLTYCRNSSYFLSSEALVDIRLFLLSGAASWWVTLCRCPTRVAFACPINYKQLWHSPQNRKCMHSSDARGWPSCFPCVWLHLLMMCVWSIEIKYLLEWALAGIAYSLQCHQQTAILLLQLQTIMHWKRAIYLSNSSIFSYFTSGRNKGSLLTHKTFCHSP